LDKARYVYIRIFMLYTFIWDHPSTLINWFICIKQNECRCVTVSYTLSYLDRVTLSDLRIIGLLYVSLEKLIHISANWNKLIV
jgi:hypothetical protein